MHTAHSTPLLPGHPPAVFRIFCRPAPGSREAPSHRNRTPAPAMNIPGAAGAKVAAPLRTADIWADRINQQAFLQERIPQRNAPSFGLFLPPTPMPFGLFRPSAQVLFSCFNIQLSAPVRAPAFVSHHQKPSQSYFMITHRTLSMKGRRRLFDRRLFGFLAAILVVGFVMAIVADFMLRKSER